MLGDLTLAGFLITYDEWQRLDDESKAQLLSAVIETGAQRAEVETYEAFEIVVE
jgi:hypothetical protein